MESVQSCDDNERFYHLRANTATLLILLPAATDAAAAAAEVFSANMT